MDNRAVRNFLLALFIALGVYVDGPAKAQDVDCRSLWGDIEFREWGDPGGDGSFPCVEYIPTPESRLYQFGMPIRLYIPSWWPASPHPRAPANTPEIIFKAMEKSFAALKPHVDLYPVTAVLLPTVYNQYEHVKEWGAAAADARAAGRTFGYACPVSIYLNSVIDQTPEQIGEVVAHEILHCIQFSSAPNQASADGANWWMEATAVYFGDKMYECATTDRWAARSYGPDIKLYQQVLAGSGLAHPLGYPSGIFFADMGDEGMFSIPRLISFMRAMPARGSGLTQEQALANRPNMGEMLHRFAESFIDGSISDCGSPVMLQPVDGPHEIAIGTTEIEVTAEPFTIKTASVTLQKDTNYKLRVERQSTLSYGMVSFRDIEVQGGWAPISNSEVSYDAGCDIEPTLQFAVTTATGSGESFQVKIIIEPEEDETPQGASIATLCGAGMNSRNANDCRHFERVKNLPRDNIDRCLIGQWRLKRGLWEHEAGIIRGMSGASVSLEVVGNPILTIREDGTMDHPAFDMEQKISAGAGSMTLTARVTAGAGRWNARNGTLDLCSVSDRENVTRTIQGPETTLTVQKAVRRKAHVGGGTYTYSCHPSELKITATGNFPEDARPWWVYQRVSSPPSQQCEE